MWKIKKFKNFKGFLGDARLGSDTANWVYQALFDIFTFSVDLQNQCMFETQNRGNVSAFQVKQIVLHVAHKPGVWLNWKKNSIRF